MEDLSKDRREIRQGDAEAGRIFHNKHVQLRHLKNKVRQFDPVSKLKEISKRLNVSQSVALMIDRQILSKQAQRF